MNAGVSAAVAAVFVWLGMVLAISFLETPLKFRAPGVTLPIGLGIGRLVFRALNACEAVLSVVVLVAMVVHPPSRWVIVTFAVAVGALIVQLGVVRPALVRRSDVVLAGVDGPDGSEGSAGSTGSRSRVHYAYVVLEAIKVMALLVTGLLLLAA